jgi:hypothetical protein
VHTNLGIDYIETMGNPKFQRLRTREYHVSRSRLQQFKLKGQSHEKVGEIRPWGVLLGPN